ncbi:MAG: PQQ-like beta-propeller repeat protein, partial [Phycisphaerae bacterium]|nr:PQQ-like beta-propeller repeat protein [Phycisphaerae bacterium]
RALPQSGSIDSDTSAAGYVGEVGRLPLQAGVVCDGTLFVRQRETLWALDAMTLTERWVAAQRRGSSSGAQSVGVLSDVDEADPLAACPPGLRVLFEQAPEHVITAGFGLVFTIESVQTPDQDSVWEVQRWGVAGRPHAQAGASELVARDARNGEVRWTLGRDALRPLYGVCFQDAPAVCESELVVLYQSGASLRVGLLDPLAGDLLAEMTLLDTPGDLTGSGGQCQIRVSDRDILISTGQGIIAAVGREARETVGGVRTTEDAGALVWRWAVEYPSMPPDVEGPVWPGEAPPPRRGAMLAPVLGSDLTIWAPPDSDEIIALERRTGWRRWCVPRGNVQSLIGTLPGGVVMAGDRVSCVDAADGRSVRWGSVPLAVTGQGVIVGGRVYVPTRDGIVALDGETGKVITDQWQPTADRQTPGWTPLANLVADGGDLYALTPNRVLKYPGSRASRDGADADPDKLSDQSRYALSAADAAAGDLSAARERLADFAPADEHLRASSAALLTEIMLAEAPALADAQQRLVMLWEAGKLAPSSELVDRVALMIAGTLVSDSQLAAAAGRYLDLMAASGTHPTMVTVGDAYQRVAVWRHAAARLATLLPSLTPDECDAVIGDGLSRAAGCDDRALLERLAVTVADDARLRRRVDAALVLWEFEGGDESRRKALCPEALGRHVQTLDESHFDERQWRHVLLKRWETATALGDAEGAARDGLAWEALGLADESLDETERAMLRRVTRAQAPLGAAQDVVLRPDFRRRWTLDGHELVLDAAHPRGAEETSILVRALSEQRVRLLRLSDGREKTAVADGVTGSATTVDLLRSVTEDALFKGRELHSDAPPFWSAVRRGSLMAVPVPGGVFGCGLGTALSGGKRLWEYPVESWRRVPDAFEGRAVADADGVCILERPDRVIR